MSTRTIPGLVHRFRKMPVECEAMLLSAYGDFTRARDWINDNGGKAYVSAGPASSVAGNRVTVVTLDGNLADVFEGWYVVRGVQGEFYPCRKDIFEASHECVEAPLTEALTGTGSYVPTAPSGSQSLSGGAAKRLMHGVADD